nr:mannitol dehydrogenase family protein [Sphingomonas japonica]
MPRLSEATLDRLPGAVARPDYDRAKTEIGVVHFGPGAFHRAHQAAAFDAVLAEDPRWAISGVSLASTGIADALRPQQGLYTLATLDRRADLRVIGSLKQLLIAADRAAILDRIAARSTRLLTATVTEKGYCLASDGTLDWDHPAIARDLTHDTAPTSLVGWIVAGLAERRRRGGGPLTVLSCDNLAANGRKLGAAVHAFAMRKDAATAQWITDMVRFPSSMVDSITPATDDALRHRVAAAIGQEDAWPVQRERFMQWVIEDDFAGERPPLEAAGVTFANDVRPFEAAKLRLVNGAHSSLAYLGLLLGHATVADAMADPRLAAFVERLMREDIAPSLETPAGLSLTDYITSILARFGNPAIEHQLSQIACDGSQKLPYRLLDAVRDARAAGRPTARLAVPVAAWLRFVERAGRGDGPLIDPLARRLLACAADPLAILDLPEVFGTLVDDRVFRDEVGSAFAALRDAPTAAALLTRR